jgi:hypothetical protein
MSDNEQRTAIEVKKIVAALGTDARLVLVEVIKIEQRHLHLGKPHGVVGEIGTAVERAIR